MNSFHINYVFVLVFLVTLSSCELNQLPRDSVAASEVFTSADGVERATRGQYALFKSQVEIRGSSNWQYVMPRAIDLLSLQGDDINVSNPYGDLINFNQYKEGTRTTDGGFNQTLWSVFYRNIGVANNVINNVEPKSEKMKQLIGENYFTRALWYHFLIRTYSRPYTHGRENMGVPLRLDTSTDPLPRATVGEVYDQIISDLMNAASRLPSADQLQHRGRASKEAAWGLLSRIYLWMTDPTDGSTNQYADSTIKYSNKVINSPNERLVSTAEYFGSNSKRPRSKVTGTPVEHYFSHSKSSSETVFCISVITTDGSVPARVEMWLKDANGNGWGQYIPSVYYREQLDNDASDLRTNFMEPKYVRDQDGNILKKTNGEDSLWVDRGYEMYGVNKFSYLDGQTYYSSFVIQRMGEIYLNRAEAYAKKGMIQEALADVNMIRSRANASTYTSVADYSNIYPKNPGDPEDNSADILDVVLAERFFELAWEFNRAYDVFRNKQNLFRNYAGSHQIHDFISWDSDQILPPLPQQEMNSNSELVQNP